MPTLSDYDVYPYRLPLTEPLQLGAHTVETRSGILVRVADRKGYEGWGDAAPLPHFSPETLDEAQQALHHLRSAVGAPNWVPERDALAGELRQMKKLRASPPSVRCAIELALWQWCAARAGTTLPHVLAETPRPRVSLNALITGAQVRIEEQGAALRAAGYRAVKMKVGRGSIEEDIRRVCALRAALGKGIAIRLDANRAWTLLEAVRFSEAVAACDIAYIEEPLADCDGLAALAEQGCPVALDETTREIMPEDLADHAYAVAVVLKPSLVGGFEAARRMGEQAAALGMAPVLSASYESGVGMTGLVALAAVLGTTDVPAGLDTYQRLASDVFTPRLPLEGPHVDVQALMHAAARSDIMPPEQV